MGERTRPAKRALQRSTTARAAADLLRRARPAARAAARAEQAALVAALPSAESAFGPDAAAEAATAPRTVLIPGLVLVRHILLQAPVLAGFIVAGYEPVVVQLGRQPTAEGLYRALGVRRFVRFDRFDRRASVQEARRAFAGVHRTADLLAVEHAGVRVGRYAASTLLRATRRSSLDLSDPATRTAAFDALLQAMDHAVAVAAIVDHVRPDASLLLDRGYTPEGAFFDRSLADGVDTFTWNAAHRDGTLLLRRYRDETRDEHPAALSNRTWEELLALPWDGTAWAAAEAELRGAYASGQWYSEVGTQFLSQVVDHDELRSRLALDERPVVGIFPHIFWDATYFWGTDLFEDYEQWFVEAVRAAYANDRVQWVIKVHPANLVKNRRDGIRDDPAEVIALRRLGPVPHHVRILPADAPIATLSLLEVLDYCCTVRGTVGVEAAALGATVITAGTGRYDHLGFTVDPATRDEFRAVLGALPDLDGTVDLERARRYAYGMLLARPLQLESVRAAFRQDEAATLDVELVDTAWADVRGRRDVATLADWIRSDRDDYVDPGRLPGA